ncbi:hypothetical protein HKX48_006807 [Thoreauomyces humboldtii]|nr:hypothetical protein HKX48_006807 [Thoreauomyces humboldtii]
MDSSSSSSLKPHLDVLPPWQDFYSAEELAGALKIFRLYREHDEYLKHAQQDPQIAELFNVARRALLPDDADLKDKRRRRKNERKVKDREVLAVTGIRQMRKVKMVGYAGGSVDIPRPPRNGTIEANKAWAEEDDMKLLEESGAHIDKKANTNQDPPTPAALGAAPSHDEPMDATFAQGTEDKPRLLTYNRSCHICGIPFRELHHFYDQMCPTCAAFNFTKRFSTADMRGRVCIVTGARVKIGYAIALKLLRMGATVMVTTRFPHDAANRFAREPDFESFGGRVAVYGLDFRDIPMLHHFCRHVQERYSRLDVIINNAAQTVRKPPAYYEHLIAGEAGGIAEHVRKVVDVVDVYRARGGGYVFGHGGGQQLSSADAAQLSEEGTPASIGLGVALPARQATAHLQDVNVSAALSQVPLIESDSSLITTKAFPPGLYDRDDQQLDLRPENSWMQDLGQISTVEMMECHVINTFAPWVLISELKPLMERSGPLDGSVGTCDKFIVNVSAMEGQFYRNKTITGWITDENPVDQWHKRENAPPPLDEWDAAMRVIDPVLCGVRGEEKVWGVFLKNYKSTRW